MTYLILSGCIFLFGFPAALLGGQESGLIGSLFGIFIWRLIDRRLPSGPQARWLKSESIQWDDPDRFKAFGWQTYATAGIVLAYTVGIYVLALVSFGTIERMHAIGSSTILPLMSWIPSINILHSISVMYSSPHNFLPGAKNFAVNAKLLELVLWGGWLIACGGIIALLLSLSKNGLLRRRIEQNIHKSKPSLIWRQFIGCLFWLGTSLPIIYFGFGLGLRGSAYDFLSLPKGIFTMAFFFAIFIMGYNALLTGGLALRLFYRAKQKMPAISAEKPPGGR